MVELFVYSTFLSNTTCPLRSFELLLADARIDTQTWGALWQWPEWVAEMCPLGREIQPDMGDSVEKGGTSMQGKCQGGKLGREMESVQKASKVEPRVHHGAFLGGRGSGLYCWSFRALLPEPVKEVP